MRRLPIATAALLALLTPALSAQAPSYDYHRPATQLVERGTQAPMICNGIFVSKRSLDLIYAQELKLNLMPLLPPSEVLIDEELRAVRVGSPSTDAVPPMRAAFREGFGCIVMAPDQTFDDIDDLPSMSNPGPPSDARPGRREL